MGETKRCGRCRKTKQLSEFYVVKKKAGDRPHSWCKKCVGEYQGQRYRAQVEVGTRGTGRRLGIQITAEGRTCVDCRKFKSRDQFNSNKNSPHGMLAYCKVCWSIRQKVRYGALSKEGDQYKRMLSSNGSRRRAMRLRIFEAYGNACACCGETTLEFLTIDHVNNDGAEHRRTIGRGDYMMRDIIKREFPPDFQLLCWNCNGAKGAYGVCPHERDRVRRIQRAPSNRRCSPTWSEDDDGRLG